MAVIVDQKRLGGGSHSTVGTITDIYTRAAPALLARRASRTSGYANAFSFNDPQGMCPECNGLGRKLGVDPDDFLDMSKSLNEGAIQVPVSSPAGRAASYAASRLLRQRQEAGGLHARRRWTCCSTARTRKFKMQFGGKPINLTLRGHHREVRARSTSSATSRRCPSARRRRSTPYMTLRPVPAVQRRAPEPGRARAARSTATTSPSCRRWRSAS